MINRNYIKMCEADNDLKWDDKAWKPKYGDYRPTQEELQEIILKDNEGAPLILILGMFFNWAKVQKRIYLDFNELWFAFVVKEKYNKVWTGNEWVDEE